MDTKNWNHVTLTRSTEIKNPVRIRYIWCVAKEKTWPEEANIAWDYKEMNFWSCSVSTYKLGLELVPASLGEAISAMEGNCLEWRLCWDFDTNNGIEPFNGLSSYNKYISLQQLYAQPSYHQANEQQKRIIKDFSQRVFECASSVWSSFTTESKLGRGVRCNIVPWIS